MITVILQHCCLSLYWCVPEWHLTQTRTQLCWNSHGTAVATNFSLVMHLRIGDLLSDTEANLLVWQSNQVKARLLAGVMSQHGSGVVKFQLCSALLLLSKVLRLYQLGLSLLLLSKVLIIYWRSYSLRVLLTVLNALKVEEIMKKILGN